MAAAAGEYSSKVAGEAGTLEYCMYIKKGDDVVSPFHDIPLWVDEAKGVVNMVIEIPQGTQPKMEISKSEYFNPIKQDTKDGKLRNVAIPYPFNYGAFPQTWENPAVVHPDTKAGGDNDPIDACEISGTVIPSGSVRQVKILGTYAMIDDGETDWKIVCIDVNDPNADKLNDINDVETVMPGKLKTVFEFLRDYKIPDGKPANKFAYNDEVKDRAFAINITKETEAEWRKLVDGKVDANGIQVANVTQQGSPGLTSAADVAQKLA